MDNCYILCYRFCTCSRKVAVLFSSHSFTFIVLYVCTTTAPAPTTNKAFKKKLDLRGASRPPSILIRRRPSNAGRETPRTPALSDLGSGAISWNHYPGRDRYPLGRETVTPGRARLTTQPKLSGAQRGGFFPTGGEIRPGGGSNPPHVECCRLLRTTRANNLRQKEINRTSND